MTQFYDFRTKQKIESEDLETYLFSEWLWRSQQRKKLKKNPFAYNDLTE